MSVKVSTWKPLRKGTNLLGFLTVEHQPSGMILSDCTALTGQRGPWISPPSKPMVGADGSVMKDASTGKIRYVPIVSFSTREQRDRWSEAVVTALREAFPDALPDEFCGMSPAEVCQLALNLARNCGYAVFPCKPDKTPATPSGFKDASAHPTTIANLWRRYPAPLIGVATGSVSGVDVVDVDCGQWPEDATQQRIEKHQAARAWWHANHGRLPSTRLYQTASNGLHLYYRHHPGVGSNQSRIAHGVDVRGDGGYVIHWFSAGHECHSHEPPAVWPPWLLALNAEPRKPPPPPIRRTAAANVETVIKRAITKVATAPEGLKHESVRKAARLLGGIQAEAGFTDTEATGWLLDVLPQSVSDWRNAVRTVEWGLAAGRTQPIRTHNG